MGESRARPTTLTAGGYTSSGGGSQAAASWLRDRRLSDSSQKRWHVEVSLATLDAPAPLQFDDTIDSRFHIDIYAEEWGFFFCHGGRASWIRITDIPFVHGRDDFHVLKRTPALADIGGLLRGFESQFQIQFQRRHALIRSNLASGEAVIRRWVESL